MTHFHDGDFPKPAPTPLSAHLIAIAASALLIAGYVTFLAHII